MESTAPEPNAPVGADIPSHRACAQCRSQKIRCIPDDAKPGVCQRCARSGRNCIFTPLQKRKQRKRTDTRVAELEKEMRKMHAMLKTKPQAAKETNSTDHKKTTRDHGVQISVSKDPNQPSPEAHSQSSLTESFGKMRAREGQDNGDAPFELQGWPTQLADWPKGNNHDIIDRGVVSIATARQLVAVYRRCLFPHFPGVVIQDSVTADDLRTKSPTLFLAVVAAAAAVDNSSLSIALDQEIIYAYAERSMIRSEKSIELVQAMLLSATWYHPPTKFGQLKYYEYIHMACAMAMDIGIGTPPSTHRGRFGQSHSGRESRSFPNVHHLEDASNPDLSMSARVLNEKTPDTASEESRRTLLSCYIIAACISFSLRRPHMLRCTSYIRGSVTLFESSPDASTKRLAMWARLTMIAEEISLSFSFDDPGAIASITDLGAQLMVKDYANRLSDWYASAPKEEMKGSLAMQYWSIRLYLHEIALHVDHSPEDFIAPYQMGTICAWDGPEIPTQVLVSAVAECIDGAHHLIDAFLDTDPISARAMPIFCYVRTCFACFILAKLCLSAAHPESVIGKVVDRPCIKAESYVDRSILHIKNVIGSTKARVPAVFLAILFKLRQWCMRPELIDEANKNNKSPADEAEAPLDGVSQTAFHGPRVSEVTNSTENTPHSKSSDATRHETATISTDVDDSGVQDTRSPTALPQIEQRPINPTSVWTDFAGSSINQDKPSQMTDLTATTAPTQVPWSNFEDQMQLDPAFYQFYTEISSMPNGGLTELGDMQSFPSDLLSMANFDWQNLPNQTNGAANGI